MDMKKEIQQKKHFWHLSTMFQIDQTSIYFDDDQGNRFKIYTQCLEENLVHLLKYFFVCF